MDYGAIIKKSWHYASKMRYLWGIGLLVALTEGAGGGTGGGYNIPSNNDSLKDIIPQKMEELPDTLTRGVENLPRVLGSENGSEAIAKILSFVQNNWLTVLIILTVLFCVWLAIIVVSYCAKAGLIQEIDNLEKGNGSGKFALVFNMGKKKFLNLLYFDILIGLSILAVVAIIGVVVFGGAISGNSTAVVLAIILGLVGLLLLLPIVCYLAMISELGRRLVVLEGLPATEAFNNARVIIKSQFGNIFITFLISIAVNILRGVIVSIISLLIFVPAILTLIAAITKSSTGVHDYFNFIITFIISLIVALFINWVINAFFAIFSYSYWNLSYRAMEYMASNKKLNSAS